MLFLVMLIILTARYLSLSQTRTFSKELTYSYVCGDEIVSVNEGTLHVRNVVSYLVNTPYATWDDLKTTSWHICWRSRKAKTWTDNGKYNAILIYRDHFSLHNLRKAPHSSPVRASYGVSFVCTNLTDDLSLQLLCRRHYHVI